MANVIYLGKGEKAPRDQRILIEEITDRSQETADSGPHGATLRIKKFDFERQLERCLAKFSDSALPIYVRRLNET